MKYTVNLVAILLLSFFSFSQETDTTKTKIFENFFGSDCPVDTLTESIGKQSQITLYSKEFKLCQVKKGRIVSTIDLSDFAKSDYICMVVRRESSKRKRKYFAFVLAYKNDVEIGRKLIEYPSGKLIMTTNHPQI